MTRTTSQIHRRGPSQDYRLVHGTSAVEIAAEAVEEEVTTIQEVAVAEMPVAITHTDADRLALGRTSGCAGFVQKRADRCSKVTSCRGR